MTRRVLLSFLCALLLTSCGPADESELTSGEDFGAGIQLSHATPLAEVLRNPERFADGPVLVHARVTDVCQRKGCWMVISDGQVDVRVRFKDYGFFLPKDCAGKLAYVEGLVTPEVLSEEEARHYEAESKGGDPSSIQGPQQVVSFMASGVRLLEAGESRGP